MNSLSLIIFEEKLRVIVLLQFSENLIALKKYLEITDYLREYIYFYEIRLKLISISNVFNDNNKCWYQSDGGSVLM